MDSVCVLWHVHKTSGLSEDEKLIGVYKTRNDAQDAIARLRTKPGFQETQEGFQIDDYELNKDHWTEGYVS
jgi:hypothetical protein